MHTFVHLQYLAEIVLKWEVFQAKVVEKIKTDITCPTKYLRESWRVCEVMEKCVRARQGIDENTARQRKDTFCMPDNEV